MATVGVGATPTFTMSHPTACRVAVTISSHMGPVTRVSRPTTILPCSLQLPNAAVKRLIFSGVRALPKMPRMPETEIISAIVVYCCYLKLLYVSLSECREYEGKMVHPLLIWVIGEDFALASTVFRARRLLYFRIGPAQIENQKGGLNI